MIPKKIHYCWCGGKPLPKLMKKCIKSWKSYCPNYEIIRWDESNFDVNCHPFVKSAYEQHAWAFVSDYARLKIIYDNGGIYLDTDVELVRNLDSLLKHQCYIGIEQGIYRCATGLGFGATKFNPVVQSMLKLYDELIYDESKKDEMACPYINNIVFERLGYQYGDEIQILDGVTIYPEKYFDPISTVMVKNLFCDETYSIHHASASWFNGTGRLKRWIATTIGNERIIVMRKVLKKLRNK